MQDLACISYTALDFADHLGTQVLSTQEDPPFCYRSTLFQAKADLRLPSISPVRLEGQQELSLCIACCHFHKSFHKSSSYFAGWVVIFFQLSEAYTCTT